MVEFTQRVIRLIKQIPYGSVATYGRIAAIAGNALAARQVSRILHSCSEKHYLPWHRVVNIRGEISLPRGRGYELQKSLLESEGIVFLKNDRIDLKNLPDTFLLI